MTTSHVRFPQSMDHATIEQMKKAAEENNKRKAEAAVQAAIADVDMEIFNGMKQTLEKMKFSG